MAFWFWVVVLSIIGLGIYELYSWYKNKKNPPAEDPAVVEPATVTHAELVRANMKIAVLESRLEESETKRNEEADALIALEERYQKRLDHTEKAYQRQMVTLSERLAANGGNGAKHDVEEYPVRMAAEVAAWRASLGGQALVEPVVSEDLAALADNLNEPIDAQGYAPDAVSEETTDPNNGAIPAAAEALEAAPENESEVEPDLSDQVILTGSLAEPEKEILDQVVVMEDVTVEPIEAEPEPAEKTADGEIESPLMPQDAEKVSEQTLEVDGEVEEIPPLENRWPDLESAAMQRVMARQLASEMDADYLDDEEFLREMGIDVDLNEPQAPALEKGWVTDPLQEMDHHINGRARPLAVEAQLELQTSDNPDRQTQMITDDMWEEVIFDSAESVYKNAGQKVDDALENDLDYATGGGEAAVSYLPEELDPEAEESAIAAAVEEILSRTPEAPQAEYSVEILEDPDPAAIDFDLQSEPPGGEDEKTPDSEDVVDEDARPPAFVWEREPVRWQAEYFANKSLADKPAAVRQEDEIDFEWLDKPPAKGVDPHTFSARWSGTLSLDPGQYRFTASAPDGLRLWLNNRLVISAWYDQSEQTYQRDFAWPGGTIDVRLEHYENGGNAKAFLTWDRIA